MSSARRTAFSSESRTQAGSLPVSRRRRERRGVLRLTLNLAPMIDVTFLLLIFFVVTTTFERAEGIFASKLPKDAGAPTAALPISPVIVRVSQAGPYGQHYRLQIENFLNPPRTFDELSGFLRDLRANPGFDRETPVVIYPETDVRWDHVVNAYNAAVRAECASITFAGS